MNASPIHWYLCKYRTINKPKERGRTTVGHRNTAENQKNTYNSFFFSRKITHLSTSYYSLVQIQTKTLSFNSFQVCQIMRNLNRQILIVEMLKVTTIKKKMEKPVNTLNVLSSYWLNYPCLRHNPSKTLMPFNIDKIVQLYIYFKQRFTKYMVISNHECHSFWRKKSLLWWELNRWKVKGFHKIR